MRQWSSPENLQLVFNCQIKNQFQSSHIHIPRQRRIDFAFGGKEGNQMIHGVHTIFLHYVPDCLGIRHIRFFHNAVKVGWNRMMPHGDHMIFSVFFLQNRYEFGANLAEGSRDKNGIHMKI